MNLRQLKILRKKLPPNYAKKISEITGYKRQTIYAVMTGKRNNLRIIECAIELAEANIGYTNGTQKKLKEVVST